MPIQVKTNERQWLCGKCAGAMVPEHHWSCSLSTLPPPDPRKVIRVRSTFRKIQQIAVSFGFLLPVNTGRDAAMK